MNSVVMGRPEVLPIAGGLGAISSWGRGGNDCGHNQDGQAVFWQKINGKGAMLETMTFWANKEFIAYVAAGGVVRFWANKEFRIQLSWHGQRRSRFLLNEEINVTAGFWVIEEFRDFSVVPFFEERSIQWSFARQRHCHFLWQT